MLLEWRDLSLSLSLSLSCHRSANDEKNRLPSIESLFFFSFSSSDDKVRGGLCIKIVGKTSNIQTDRNGGAGGAFDRMPPSSLPNFAGPFWATI